MGTIFNTPGLAVGLEPPCGGELSLGEVGDETDGFVFASDVLAD